MDGSTDGRTDPGDPRVRRARLAIAAVFAVHGAVSGNLATRIPWIQEHTGIGPGLLGLALTCPAVGAALAMPLAGRVGHRYGSRAGLRALLCLLCASLALPALCPGLVALCGAMAVYGAASGMADVAMNALGVRTEELLGRPVMSGLHGMWSVGALAGSAAGTVAAHTGTGARLHLGLAAVVLLGLGVLVCHGVLDLRPGPDEDAPPRFALPRRAVLAIGAVGFCAVFAEGASLDWSAVYLRDVIGSDAGVAAACTTAFSCTMAVARLAGDAVVGRFGPVRTVRAGGVLAGLGGILVVCAHEAVQAMAGFGLLGLGIAVVVPLAFAAAGRSGPEPSGAIAGVATITYTSWLVAPGLIGQLAHATSLTVSFTLVTVTAAGLTVVAGALRTPSGHAVETAAVSSPARR
ncbi:MFS transporter [Streptomyces cinnamoneus]|uniref:MFS transporter n=1 Tax=Streptomyces cinnamoneus TaxID=53446 RepID=A0A2G1XPQ9_STRCJ|nr:MFS transporter [Streptomyces cinnamoneus]PHQ53206.1 MFS transporter [Streptomyces cinnamoneus]PPT12298.1 MFS transporter [Streptomyces cinnamoneus]